ncbi:hypothetical protein [Actinomadura sp. DC4]|uniref:hypothetical protein n=1 Tax=Actinomadura sp. DC4 TaxID=3055069 RepID=UPI0025B1A6CC|nr:hypothetical protein [Actinomadura sp. DC4]MDN3360021.1 hypothetical protein [Actinomadura sp. DC4]
MRRTACIALLAAGTFVGLSAAPADAAARPVRRPQADDPGLLGLQVRLGCPLCVELDALHAVHVRVHVGPGDCDEVAPPRPPSPRPPSPKPPSPKPPPRPPKPTPSAPARPPGRVAAPVRAAPVAVPSAPHRVSPPARRPPPAPTIAAPSHRASVPKAAAMPRRRKNPLATLMVLVVITAVIAAGAGVAFSAAP